MPFVTPGYKTSMSFCPDSTDSICYGTRGITWRYLLSMKPLAHLLLQVIKHTRFVPVPDRMIFSWDGLAVEVSLSWLLDTLGFV